MIRLKMENDTIYFARLLVKKLFVLSAKLESEVCRIMVKK